mgnify:CR=1 FL=1
MKVLLVVLATCAAAVAQGVPSEEELKALHETVSRIRGLEFKHPVAAAPLPMAALRKEWKRMLEAGTTPEQFQAEARALTKLGFLSAGTDLEEALLDMYTNGIHAYYDPVPGGLYVIDRTEARDETMYGLLTKMLLAGHGARREDLFVAHELTHALQDQHFRYFMRLALMMGDDDRFNAARALSEGDANLVLYEVLAGLGGKTAEDLFATTGEHAFDEEQLLGIPGYDRAPRALRLPLTFSYTQGVRFVRALREKGGWKAIDAAFTDPPASTEQVLHPEKYLGERDVPQLVTLPDLSAKLDGWRLTKRGILGELMIRLVAEAPGADAMRAAAGWDGDAYEVWEREKDGRLLLVLASTWDSEEDAKDFHDAMLAALKTRSDIGPPGVGSGADCVAWVSDAGGVATDRSGRDVVVLDGTEGSAVDMAGTVLSGMRKEERK